MTFAGFFVHLSDIPPVLRWLQWLCPLKYTLEALSVNEVVGGPGSGLMIEDTLQGVPVDVSASLIMQLVSFSFSLFPFFFLAPPTPAHDFGGWGWEVGISGYPCNYHPIPITSTNQKKKEKKKKRERDQVLTGYFCVKRLR